MKYCVYLTTYAGNKMPSNYVGSTSVDRIESGYCGSVRSKRWRKVWEAELSEAPELFTVCVLSLHTTRQEALQEELRVQIKNDVVKSNDWINESLAQPNGFAGRDVSGSNNPMFGRGIKMKEWCASHPTELSQRNRKAAYTRWSNADTRQSRIDCMRGKPKSRKTLTEEQFVELQRSKSAKSALTNSKKIPYNGVIYNGWQELLNATGVTKHLYNKYYLNGIDPLIRKGAAGPISHNEEGRVPK